MKKLKFIFLIIPFLFIKNVYAINLGTPFVHVTYVDNSTQNGNANISSWWNQDYYEAPFRIGYFTPATPEAKEISYIWNNSNLCSGQNLQITGYIGGLFNFFSENSYTTNFFNNSTRMTCSISQEDNSRIKYTCVGVGGGSLWLNVVQNSFTSHNNYQIGVSRNQDITCDVTNLEIMQQNILNTQNIINNQTNNTNSIINNQNTNTQNIINNQNENTEKQIESQLSCRNSNNYSMVYDGYLTSTGGTASSTGTQTSDYISIPKQIIPLTTGSTRRLCFYSSRSTSGFISCISNSDMTIDVPLTIPSNAKYFRFTKLNSTNQPIYKFCSNGNEMITEEITSDASPDTDNYLQDFTNDVSSTTPISDLILLPLTLINKFITGVNSSCSPFNLGNLYGTELILPCIDLEQRLGSDLWGKIDALISIFMCYNIGMLFVSAWDGITSLRDDFESLYQPRHADTGYKPKHGG